MILFFEHTYIPIDRYPLPQQDIINKGNDFIMAKKIENYFPFTIKNQPTQIAFISGYIDRFIHDKEEGYSKD
ncbi:MAG: hypothetical protein ACXWWC_05775 [Chitinophagaceae bacterium]